MTENLCPACKGECCRDDLGYRVVHYGAELYEHVCDYCGDGTKYVPPRTYEDGLAEGERRATAAVVAYLLKYSASSFDRSHEWGDDVPARVALSRAAHRIERGEHRREEEG